MTEEYARETIAQLWRNHPSGASTFHECAADGCKTAARDKFCSGHIVKYYKGNRARLGILLHHIQKIREIEREIVAECED